MKELDWKNIMLNKIVELGYPKQEVKELMKVSKNIEEDYFFIETNEKWIPLKKTI